MKISQQKGRKGRTVWTVSILDELFQVICDARVDVLALIKFDWTIFIYPKGHDVRRDEILGGVFYDDGKNIKRRRREEKLHARRKAEKKKEKHTQRYFPRA